MCDLVACLHLYRHVVSPGAIMWAACGKDEGYTPERILHEVQRRVRFHAKDIGAFNNLYWVRRADLVKLRHSWEVAVAKSHRLIESFPPDELGCLYLDKTGPRRQAEFRRLQRHRSTVRGALPVGQEPHQKST